jgi:endoglucanase
MRIAAITVLSLLLIPVILPEKLRAQSLSPTLQPNDPWYSDKPGLNITVFNNWYNGLFKDFSGVELIHQQAGLMTTKK